MSGSMRIDQSVINHLSANPTKWSNSLKQFVGNLPTNCLSVFDHFLILASKGLNFPEKNILLLSKLLLSTEQIVRIKKMVTVIS